MKLYLVGGGDTKETNRIYRKAIRPIKNPHLLIFHWTSKNKKKLKHYRKIMIKQFKKLGIRKIEIAEFNDSYSVIKDKINMCNVIFLPGGDTELLIKTIKSKRITRLLRNFKGVIIGMSAGAYTLSKQYVRMQNKKIRRIPALNFLNIKMKAHYNEKFDPVILKFSKREKIYGVPDSSCLILDGKKLKFFGKIYLFSKGKKKRIN